MTAINNKQNVDTLLESIDKINMMGASEASAAQVKDQIETLFTDMQTYNEGEEGAKKIEKQIATLQGKIEDLEEEAQKILADIEESNDEANKKGDALADSAADLTNATGKFQDATAQAARYAAKDAIASYKRGNGDQDFATCFNEAFKKRLGGLQANQSEIQSLYEIYEANKAGITSIADEIGRALDKVNGLEAQLKNVNATISLLTRTKNIMEQSMVEDAYKNVDTDTKVPIFSGAKAEVANQLLSQYQSRYTAEGDLTAVQNAGANAENIEATKTEWLGQKQGNYSNGDKYSAQQNPELMNLRNLIAGGMIDDLQASGMNVDEIMTFVQANWDVGITKNGNNWKIPYGHSSDAWVKEPAFVALTELITSSQKSVTADSVNQTQMAEMKKAVEEDGILTTMYEAGFTFKEAMYTFTQLFPDAGIIYDLSDQSGKRTYQKVADNEASGTLYKTIGEQILNYWNVGGDAAKEGDDSTSGEVDRFDPMTFQDGNTTYTFLNAEKMEDGTFDYANGKENDLLGSERGAEELIAYDYNGDGVIDGNDSRKVDGKTVYALDEMMLMANNQDESVGSKADVDAYKKGPSYTNSVDFKVSYSSARDAGITSIDISKMVGTGSGDDIADSTRGDNYQESYDDINGSSVINTFTVTKDGKDIEGKETLNTADNLETFYGQIADDANASQALIHATDEDVEDAYENAPGSDIIDNVKDRLEQMKDETPATDEYLYGDVVIDADDIHELTGLAYLTGIRDSARKAAERHITDPSDASDAAEEAVNEYWDEHINPKNDKDDAANDSDKKEQEQQKDEDK